jgi:hypothetical protein
MLSAAKDLTWGIICDGCTSRQNKSPTDAEKGFDAIGCG